MADDDAFDLDGLDFGEVELEPKKKRKNSKAKGNRVELELTKILAKRFGKSFSRAVGSGNRWGQVSNMPSHAKETLTGDICPPEGFKWVIECKGGYEDKIDFNNVGKNTQVDAFIEQSSEDAKRSNGRKPIIVYKRSRKPWMAMVKDVEMDGWHHHFPYRIHYNGWVIVPLEQLLEVTKDDYWFDE